MSTEKFAKSLKSEFKSLSQSHFAGQVSKQWAEYEKKMKDFVKDMNLRSRDAREKSREQLDKFTDQLKTARTQIEKKVSDVVNQEAKVINKAVGDLRTYLKTVSRSEREKTPVKSTAIKAKSKKMAKGEKSVIAKPAAKKTATKKSTRTSRSTSKGQERTNEPEVGTNL
jgi:hypothetical protein